MTQSFLMGIGIGLIYFGGLYWSTGKIDSVKSPAFLMIASMLLRMIILLLGLYYLAQSGYQSVLAGFVGIMIVRFIMVYQVKKQT